jgi:hypothetical protein
MPLKWSNDGGGSWNFDRRIHGTGQVLTHPHNANTVFAATLNGFARSTDAGDTWATVGIGSLGYGSVLAIDEQDPKILYAAAWDIYANMARDGAFSDRIDTSSTSSVWNVYKSIDSGDTWLTHIQGLDGSDITSLGLGSGVQNTVYLGTVNGLFRLVDSTTKTPLSPGVPQLTMYATGTCIGTPWTLRVTGATSNRTVRLLGTQNKYSWEVTEWGQTGPNGSFTETGSFPPGSEDNYVLQVIVDGVASNTVSFAVTACQTTP